MSKRTEAGQDMFSALHIAEMQIRADFNTRIQQPVERSANETILIVIRDAIIAGKKDGYVCDCPDHKVKS